MKPDLSVSYLGLRLANPCILAPGPITASLDQLARYVDAGASAAVLPSIFEDQIEESKAAADALYECRTDIPTESLSYFDEMKDYNQGPDSYLRYLEAAKKRVDVPVIASIGATNPGEWSSFARSLQNTGADAVELNIYFVPTDPLLTGHDVENRYLEIVSDVSSTLSIPMAVKLGPYFSSLPHFADRLSEDGASGLVLFNRYLEPDVDIETREIWPRLDLSRRGELRLALRWIAVLSDQLDISLAATGGVHSMIDIVKSLLVGADAVMMASSLIEKGPEHLGKLIDELSGWMQEKSIRSMQELKGQLKHLKTEAHAERSERENYLRAIVSFSNRWKGEHS